MWLRSSSNAGESCAPAYCIVREASLAQVVISAVLAQLAAIDIVRRNRHQPPASFSATTVAGRIMDFYIPNFVSYEMLLQAVCAKAVTGRSTDEIVYIVELAEELCKLMRELDQRARAQ